MPTYPPDVAAPQTVTPLDPDAVIPYRFDFSDWLAGETIAGFDVDVPAGLLTGDGVTVVVTAAGNVTPPAPAEAAGVVTVWLYNDTGVAGDTFVVRCRVRTSGGRVEDKSLSTTLAEK